MIYVFYFFAAVLVWLSYRSFRGGIEYLNYFKRELAKPPSEWTPMVTIIAPCKGVDEGMLANFDALLDQDLPEFEVIFVIDDPDDPAAGVVEAAWQEAERHVKLVVAPKAVVSSQKVENMREGVLHADERSEVFVFVDSDARPSPGWLRALIAPLKDDTVGAATGYRWFISERANLASELRSAWNGSIASALGPNENGNFTWGGSMAIRRDTFDRIGMREKWQGTLSDDFAVTRVIRDSFLRIRFVPQALTATVDNCTFRGLFEFTNRQMKVTRVYVFYLWLLSFFGSVLFCTVCGLSLLILFIYAVGSFPWWAAAATLLLVAGFSFGKALLRHSAVTLALPQHSTGLRRQRKWQLTLWAVTPAIYLTNCIAALFSNRLVWRGIEYRMLTPEKTLLIRHD